MNEIWLEFGFIVISNICIFQIYCMLMGIMWWLLSSFRLTSLQLFYCTTSSFFFFFLLSQTETDQKWVLRPLPAHAIRATGGICEGHAASRVHATCGRKWPNGGRNWEAFRPASPLFFCLLCTQNATFCLGRVTTALRLRGQEKKKRKLEDSALPCQRTTWR